MKEINKNLALAIKNAFEIENPSFENFNLMVTTLGADINTQDEHGRTLLMLAAAKNNTKSLKGWLSMRDADANIRDKDGLRAIDYATDEKTRATLAYFTDPSRVPEPTGCFCFFNRVSIQR